MLKMVNRYYMKSTGNRMKLDPRIGYHLRVTTQHPVGIYNQEDNLHPNVVLQPGDPEFIVDEACWIGSLTGKSRFFVEEYLSGEL